MTEKEIVGRLEKLEKRVAELEKKLTTLKFDGTCCFENIRQKNKKYQSKHHSSLFSQ